MQNQKVIIGSHDVEALLRSARKHPTETLIQKIIDMGIDCNGNAASMQQAALSWRSAVAA